MSFCYLIIRASVMEGYFFCAFDREIFVAADGIRITQMNGSEAGSVERTISPGYNIQIIIGK